MPAATPQRAHHLRVCWRAAVAAAAARRARSNPRAGRAELGRRRAGRRAVRLRGPGHGGALVGFEVDLADALARALGVRARFVQNDWTTLIPSLERGTFDIALNGIEVTPALAARVAFSRPYYRFSRAAGRAPGRRARARSRVDGGAARRHAGEQPGVAARAGRRRRRRSRTKASTSRSSTSRTGAPTPCCSTTSSSRATPPATRRWRWSRMSPRAATRSRMRPQDEDLRAGDRSRARRRAGVGGVASHPRALADRRPAPGGAGAWRPTRRSPRRRGDAPLSPRQLALFLQGALVTLLISLAAMALAAPLGLVLALVRLREPRACARSPRPTSRSSVARRCCCSSTSSTTGSPT